MRHLKLFLFLIATLAVALTVSVSGQNGPPPQDATHNDRPDDARPNLMAELGLSPEQVQQIRRMNQGRRPAMQDANRRLREANRQLDIAIYDDTLVSDAEFQTRLKEFQTAQAEVARLRFDGEFSVRKILTPEQLIKFRELRRRFAEMRKENMRERPRRGDGPGIPPMKDGRDMRPMRDGRGTPPMKDAPQRRPIN